MSNYVSIIFCKNCNSRYVEIEEWARLEKKVIIHCRTCDERKTLENFRAQHHRSYPVPLFAPNAISHGAKIAHMF